MGSRATETGFPLLLFRLLRTQNVVLEPSLSTSLSPHISTMCRKREEERRRTSAGGKSHDIQTKVVQIGVVVQRVLKNEGNWENGYESPGEVQRDEQRNAS